MGNSAINIPTNTSDVSVRSFEALIRYMMLDLSQIPTDERRQVELSILNGMSEKNTAFYDDTYGRINRYLELLADPMYVNTAQAELTMYSDAFSENLTQLSDLLTTLSNANASMTVTLNNFTNIVDNIESNISTSDMSQVLGALEALNADLAMAADNLDLKVDNTTKINNKPLTQDIILNKNDFTLGNVTNDSGLAFGPDAYAQFPEKITPIQSDLLLVEDESASYSKRKMPLSKIPIDNVSSAKLNSLVTTTTTVNSIPLSNNVNITKAIVGLGNVDNTSDVSRPVSTATQTLLDTKVTRKNITPKSFTKSNNVLQLSTDTDGLVTNSSEIPIQITPAQAQLVNVQNVDTTRSSNVTIDTPFTPTTSSGVITTSDTTHSALEKLQGSIDNKIKVVSVGNNDRILLQDSTGIAIVSTKAFHNNLNDVNAVSTDSVLTGSAVSQLIDNKLVQVLNYRGGIALTGSTPLPTNGSGPGGSVRKNDTWVTQNGTGSFATVTPVQIGSLITALVDNPSVASSNDWLIIQNLYDKSPENIDNKSVSLSQPDSVTYPSSKAVGDALVVSLPQYQTLLPAGGTTSQYLRADKTFAVLNKAAAGLSIVPNTKQMSRDPNTFQSQYDNMTTPHPATDVLLTESINNSYDKRHSTMQSLPLSTLFNSMVSARVAKTLTVNTQPLNSPSITLTKAHFTDLNNVMNVSDANLPVSSATQITLQNKVNKLTTSLPVATVGAADRAITMSYNADGQITDAVQTSLNLTNSVTGFSNVQNVDTTKQSNVLIDEPLEASVLLPLQAADSGIRAFSRTVNTLNTKIGLIGNGVADDIVMVNSSVSNGRLSSTGIKIDPLATTSDKLMPANKVLEYIDNSFNGLLNFQADYNASGNVYPTVGSGSGGIVKTGDYWNISQPGVLSGEILSTGDVIFAVVDNPGSVRSNWVFLEGNASYIRENTANKRDDIIDPNSAVLYPTNRLTLEKITDSMLLKEPPLPTLGTNTQYIRGDKTLHTLDLNAVGLGNVTNDEQLSRANNAFQSIPLKETPQLNDIILVETATGGMKRYVRIANIPANSAQSTQLQTKVDKTQQINSVPLSTNTIVLTKSDFALDQIDNTSDAVKPVSTALQALMDLRVPTSRLINLKPLTANNLILDKSDVGLDQVDNTADIDKLSNATHLAALNAKVDKLIPASVDNLAAINSASGQLVDTTHSIVSSGVGTTTIPTAQYAYDIITQSISGGMKFVGCYDASVNAFPVNGDGSGAAGAIRKGDFWKICMSGTLGTQTVELGDVIFSNVDAPTTPADWTILNKNIGFEPEYAQNKESVALDNNTMKYPSNNIAKVAIDNRVSELAIVASPANVGEIVTMDAQGDLTSSGFTPTNTFINSNTSINTASAIQGELDSKQNVLTAGAVSGLVSSDLTAERALISDSNGKIVASSVTAAELAHMQGVTSPVQTQLNSKQSQITISVASEAAMLALSSTQVGDIVIRTDENNVFYRLNALPPATLANWSSLGGGGSGGGGAESVIPAQDFNNFDYPGLVQYINELSSFNKNSSHNVVPYTHGVSAVSGAYFGGVYSPTQNRIYLVPQGQASQPQWHYVDCDTGSVVAYTHGVSAVIGAYFGGVYSPTQNRIYFVPRSQANQPQWHYVNCGTGNVVAYTHGVSAVNTAYQGGVYSPTQNRIYFVPRNQAPQPQWHYVNCNTGSVIAYTHGVTAVSAAYEGCVYSPTQNRIYFVPWAQSNQPQWHYIDCDTGSVVAYTQGVSAVNTAYIGGVYSPTQNRIYFVPFSQAPESQWHYIDCNTGSVVAYTHGVTAVSNAYSGGVYSPTQNRIYFVPRDQATQPQWHYVNCNTGSVVAYTRGVSTVSSAYYGGVYSPTQNRIYFVPLNQVPLPQWYYIDCNTEAVASVDLMSGALFNKL